MTWACCLMTLSLCITPPVRAMDEVPICQLLQHAERYDNKVISVTGTYQHGRHVAAVANANCGFPSRYRAFGQGAAANIEPYDTSGSVSQSAGKLLDRKSIEAFDRAVTLRAGKPSNDAVNIHVKFLVLVQVAKHYSITESAPGGPIGTGFGFMGRYPVQLMLLRVEWFRVSQ